MSLETVVKSIRQEAKKECEELRMQGEGEAEKILKEAHAKRDKILADALKEAVKAADRLRTHELARVELENKRARLVMEKELLDQAIERAKERIRNLRPVLDQDLMRRLITKHQSEGTVVHSADRHDSLVRGSCSLRYGGHIDCLGGIIIESADGSVRFDYTYDSILERASDMAMKEVARILFED
jgi:V/A-type H+-transporting ATPase subunit E